MTDKSVLIAAMVAVVAVIGLVTFGAGTTGNLIKINPESPSYRGTAPVATQAEYIYGESMGSEIATTCLRETVSQQQCCSRLCGDASVSMDMQRGCANVCQLIVAQAASDHIDWR